MHVLIGWDNSLEGETIDLLLNVGEIRARLTTGAEEFESAAASGCYDVVLLAINFPHREAAFPLFKRTREWQPQAAILGACHPGEVVELARFINHGLHSFITRDPQGEFILVLRAAIESAHASVQSQRARELAERLRQEIDSVRMVQEAVIPHNLPVPEGYRIVARYEPSQIRILEDRPVVLAGGDYYDVFILEGTTLIILVGDAAGHGIKACMSIMAMHTLIRAIRERRYRDTAHFVTEVNRRLVDNEIVRAEGGFITLMYCALDMTTHRLQWTSAGHPLPLLQDLQSGRVIPLGNGESGGMPLGIMEDETYSIGSAVLPENSRLLLYSDGLADAFGPDPQQHQRYGEQGIIATLQATMCQPLEQAMDRLFYDSNAFTGGDGRHDDTSVVLLERTGRTPRWEPQ